MFSNTSGLNIWSRYSYSVLNWIVCLYLRFSESNQYDYTYAATLHYMTLKNVFLLKSIHFLRASINTFIFSVAWHQKLVVYTQQILCDIIYYMHRYIVSFESLTFLSCITQKLLFPPKAFSLQNQNLYDIIYCMHLYQ